MKKTIQRMLIVNLVFFAACVCGIFLQQSRCKYLSSQPQYTLIQNENKQGLRSLPEDQKEIPVDENAVFHDDVCSAEFSLSKEWQESDDIIICMGAQYEFIVYNNTDKDMNDWTLSFKVGEKDYIQSDTTYWEGEFVQDGTLITVSPLDYNTVIFAHDFRKVGCMLITAPYTLNIEQIQLVYYVDYALKDSLVYRGILLAMLLFFVIDIVFIIVAAYLSKYEKDQFQQRKITVQALRTIANTIDAKDEYTRGHSSRVAYYASLIAKRMHMSEEEQRRIYYIALLHDIGKIGVPDEILNKPGKLTPEEREKINLHVTVGGQILQDFTSIPGIVEGALYHHERFDGNGYMNGLKGDEIPLVARIICVADSYDAMSSARCYRPALDTDYIIRELQENAGKQFDPMITPYMLDMIEEGCVPVSEVSEEWIKNNI